MEAKAFLFGESHGNKHHRRDFIATVKLLNALKERCALSVEGNSKPKEFEDLPSELVSTLYNWCASKLITASGEPLAEFVCNNQDGYTLAISKFLNMIDEQSSLLEKPAINLDQVNALFKQYSDEHSMFNFTQIDNIELIDDLNKLKFDILTNQSIIASALLCYMETSHIGVIETVDSFSLIRESSLVDHITQDLDKGCNSIVLAGNTARCRSVSHNTITKRQKNRRYFLNTTKDGF